MVVRGELAPTRNFNQVPFTDFRIRRAVAIVWDMTSGEEDNRGNEKKKIPHRGPTVESAKALGAVDCSIWLGSVFA
jgi:hypothetical protein